MTKRLKQIQLINLDERFEKMRFEPKPKSGWIKTIREALSMPLAFPANKLGASKQSIIRFEKNEVDESITLKSLRKLAEAMDCELHYAIVPHGRSLRGSLQEGTKFPTNPLKSFIYLASQGKTDFRIINQHLYNPL